MSKKRIARAFSSLVITYAASFEPDLPHTVDVRAGDLIQVIFMFNGKKNPVTGIPPGWQLIKGASKEFAVYVCEVPRFPVDAGDNAFTLSRDLKEEIVITIHIPIEY